MKLTDLNNKFSQQKWIVEELKELELRCQEDHIPLLDRDAADFLKLQLKIKQPVKILEIGTAYGFSTLLMAKYSAAKAKITSVELEPELVEIARQNFIKYDYNDKINLKAGDAFDVLLYLQDKFDFILLDAAKGQYLYLLEYVFDLLKPGGILLTDNVLYKGLVLKQGPIRHKVRTIVNNLSDFLKLIMNHPELDSTIITAGDGMALSRRKILNEES
jgi:predicted O-methyltransferase YrrM